MNTKDPYSMMIERIKALNQIIEKLPKSKPDKIMGILNGAENE